MTLKPGVTWLGLAVILIGLGWLCWGGLAAPVHAAAPRTSPPDDDGLPGASLTVTTAYTGYLPIIFGGQPAPITPTPPPTPQQSPAEELIALINAERASRGLPPLTAHPILTAVAQAHSQDMVTRDFFGHTNPDGLDPCQRMTRAGYRWYACGENIAAGFPTAAMVLMIWLNSDGHRANLLSPYFTEIGVGYAQGGDYHHYWTLDLGARQ